MAKHLTEQNLREIPITACCHAGTQRVWADAHGLSPAFVNDVLQGKRGVTDRIAGALGYVKLATAIRKADR
ncbi:MAG TPA: hypothetical protein VK638_46390 [Edaphobacter sp.]|nr:hypothetical protein [Edaphobacter sp.]